MRLSSITREQAIDCLKRGSFAVASAATFLVAGKIWFRVALIAIEIFVEIKKSSFHNLDRNALAIIGTAFISIHLVMLGVYFLFKVFKQKDEVGVTLYFRSFTLLEFVAIRPID